MRTVILIQMHADKLNDSNYRNANKTLTAILRVLK